jgi:hypothetical protein
MFQNPTFPPPCMCTKYTSLLILVYVLKYIMSSGLYPIEPCIQACPLKIISIFSPKWHRCLPILKALKNNGYPDLSFLLEAINWNS